MESGEGGEGKSFYSEETLTTSGLKATKATPILILFSSQTVSPVAGLSQRPEGGCSDLPEHNTRASRREHEFEIRTYDLLLVMGILGLSLQAWS